MNYWSVHKTSLVYHQASPGDPCLGGVMPRKGAVLAVFSTLHPTGAGSREKREDLPDRMCWEPSLSLKEEQERGGVPLSLGSQVLTKLFYPFMGWSGPCCPFLQSRAKLSLRNILIWHSLKAEQCWKERMWQGPPLSVRWTGSWWKMGRIFPRGEAQVGRRDRCLEAWKKIREHSCCWQKALLGWRRPDEILADHQHDHGGDRNRMQLIRGNRIPSKASEQTLSMQGNCRGNSKWVNSKNLGIRVKKGKIILPTLPSDVTVDWC